MKKIDLIIISVLKYVCDFSEIHKLVNDSDILMGLVPMFHEYGLLIMCMCMKIGSQLIVHKKFEADLFLKSIEAFNRV